MEKWNDGIWNGNRYFQACQKCVAPKRFPGCQGVCKEYAADKEAYEKIKASMRQEKEVDAVIRAASIRINHYYGDKKKESFQ